MTTDKTPATLATVKHGGCVQLGTPGSRWAASGEPDPHGTRYDCERAALVLGDLTDDELANAVFMHGNERQTMAELVGGATPAITYLTAAKDRIRWLSRALAAAESLSAQPSPGGQGDALAMIGSNLRSILSLCKLEGQPVSKVDAANIQHEARHALQLLDLAARQPVGEPVAKSVGIDALVQLLVDDAEECAKGWVERGDAYASGKSAGLLAAADYFRKIATSQRWSEFLSSPAQAVAADGFWLAVDDDGFVHFGQSTDDGNGGVGVRENVESRINDWLDNDGRSVDLVWAGSAPAQAVDLGQFRAQVAVLLRSEFDLEVADPEDHRNDDGAGEADRIASKIAALLDSQAVGNG